jgi:hypothetical protein
VIHLAAAAFLLFGLEAYLNREIRSLSAEGGRIERSIVAEVVKVREAAVQANDAQHQIAEALEADVAAAPVQVAAEAREAEAEAQRRAALLARRMARSRRKQLARVTSELASIRANSQAASEAALRLHSDLHAAGSAALADRGEARGAQKDLAAVEEDLGALTERVHGNATQWTAFRASSRRESFPFRAARRAPRTEAGGLAILLRNADPKHQRFTLEITAADGRTERREGTLNEPIRLGGSYELVVDEIAKNEVGGQLARDYSSGSAETRNFPGR